MKNKYEIVVCNEGMHYTGARAITDADHPFFGGVEIVQQYPDVVMGINAEKVIIRQEDLALFAQELVKLAKEINLKF